MFVRIKSLFVYLPDHGCLLYLNLFPFLLTSFPPFSQLLLPLLLLVSGWLKWPLTCLSKVVCKVILIRNLYQGRFIIRHFPEITSSKKRYLKGPTWNFDFDICFSVFVFFTSLQRKISRAEKIFYQWRWFLTLRNGRRWQW